MLTEDSPNNSSRSASSRYPRTRESFSAQPRERESVTIQPRESISTKTRESFSVPPRDRESVCFQPKERGEFYSGEARNSREREYSSQLRPNSFNRDSESSSSGVYSDTLTSRCAIKVMARPPLHLNPILFSTPPHSLPLNPILFSSPPHSLPLNPIVFSTPPSSLSLDPILFSSRSLVVSHPTLYLLALFCPGPVLWVVT